MTGARAQPVLVASDLGPASDDVVRTAAALAAATGAELHLVHALEIGDLPPLDHPTYPGRFRQAEALLDEQFRRAAPGVAPASRWVVDYVPDRAVHDRAEQVGAGLVVLGPHRGGGGVGMHFLGTTADRVIRESGVPVLIARGTLPLPLRRIGVPVDFSATGGAALGLALSFAGALGSLDGGGTEVVAFHVGWSVEREDDPGLERGQLLPALEHEVERAREEAGAAAVRVRTEVLWEASPTEAIATHAGRERLELLVMGTHGRGGLKRLLVGSVASGVARQAPCPVLLVPPPREESGSAA